MLYPFCLSKKSLLFELCVLGIEPALEDNFEDEYVVSAVRIHN